MVEVKKLVADLVLVPGFPEPRSRVLSVIPQTCRTVPEYGALLGAGDTQYQDPAPFLSFSTLESLRFHDKGTPVFSLIMGVKKNFGWPFLLESA